MENNYTITEAANKLLITRQSVYRKIKKLQNELQQFLTIENNTQYISEEGIDIIKKNLSCNKNLKQNENVTNESNNKSDNVTEIQNIITIFQKQYENQIIDLKKQFEKEIEHLRNESMEKNKLLENMQILLRDQKLLVEAKNKFWWQFWKKN